MNDEHRLKISDFAIFSNLKSLIIIRRSSS